MHQSAARMNRAQKDSCIETLTGNNNFAVQNMHLLSNHASKNLLQIFCRDSLPKDPTDPIFRLHFISSRLRPLADAIAMPASISFTF